MRSFGLIKCGDRMAVVKEASSTPDSRFELRNLMDTNVYDLFRGECQEIREDYIPRVN